MTEPLPVGDAVPLALRRGLSEADLVDAEDPFRLGESPDEAQARAQARAASRGRIWSQCVPARFADASVADLTEDQNPRGAVSGWLDSDSRMLVLRSEAPGVGKTHAAYAVANAAVAAGVWAWAWSAIDLNDALRPGEHTEHARITAYECDLLVLDDLGREQVSGWTIERLHGLLDARWRNAGRTIITTNLSGQQFTERYGDPVLDRIIDDARIVTVTGVTRRKQAPW